MIFKGSSLIIADNTGAKVGKCIKLMKKNRRAISGDIILMTLHKFKKVNKKIKKRTIYLGIIVSTRFWSFRLNGFYLRFFFNKVLVFSNQLRFLGTRILGVVDRVFKKKAFIYKDVKIFYKTLGYSCGSI